MDTRVVVPRQPRGGGKVKNEAAQGRDRRVLGDIGNLQTLHAVEGKITRPITRSFRAQLLANAQAAAEMNENLVTAAVDDAVPIDRKVGVVKKVVKGQKKDSDKEKANAIETEKKLSDKPETVILISPDSVRKSRERSSRNKVKTLTSILTARSKVAFEVTNRPQNQIVNIDAADVSDELAVVEYVDDLYKFYSLTEDERQVHDYMVSQPYINRRMRMILVDWLIDVHSKFELMPETLYLTINIVDRYLSTKVVTRRELQLVGISSMLIACKYEEIWAPLVNDFVCISDYAYVGEQVLVMEKAILEKLEWYLTVPTPYVFLVRYIKASVLPNQEMENLVYFLAELGLMHYSTIVSYSPSMIAAAAVYAARCTLNKSPFWSETLKHHTGYSEEQLMDCAKLLATFHSAAATSDLKTVYKKFSNQEKGAVALFSPAKSLLTITMS